MSVAPNKQVTLTSALYAGPKIQSNLKPLAEGLDKTVDYGILWPISKKCYFGFFDNVHKVLGQLGLVNYWLLLYWLNLR